MPRKVVKISKNVKDTSKIAKNFLIKILKNKGKKALVVGLSGELGAGKTAFTKAVGKLLGVNKNINSPTFVIIKKYLLKNEYKYFFHLDAYRLKNEKELLHLGWQEIIDNNKHLVFIEWPENVIKIMPKNSYFIYISQTKEGHRILTLKNKKTT